MENRKGSIGKHLPAWDEKAMEINRADVAELVDARDLKSLDGNVVWVRVPPPAPSQIRFLSARLVRLEPVPNPVTGERDLTVYQSSNFCRVRLVDQRETLTIVSI
jgi:hypothetical protein